MGVAIAIIVVVVCLGGLIIAFGRSMHQQRQRRLQVKSKWSPTPDGRGDDRGTH
jgi:hypothetical protein